MMKFLILALCFLNIPVTRAYGAESQDKRQYDLFNPTPKALMREMSTDRPDKTESPYTVDAGHYQMEMSLIDYTYDHRNVTRADQRIDNFSFVPSNFKVGLLNNVDLQLLVDPYIKEKAVGDGDKERKKGFGNIQSRLKINFWGNDGSPTALAIMPFASFPTNTGDLGHGALEGGVIVPLAVSLPGDWNMGLMTEFDFNRNENKDYYTDFINSITFGHSIIGDLSGYVEFFSSINDQEDSKWVGTVDLGLTYAISNDIQLDGGVNIGVTRLADDFNPFLGCSMRY